MPGNVTATNLTVAGNRLGSAILGSGPNMMFTHATIVDNEGAVQIDVGGHLTFRESILWGAGAYLGSPLSNAATIERSILEGGCPQGGVATCTDLVSGDPRLGVRRMNGGLTPTYALGAGSAAIDAGRSAICATTLRDQRGVVRPVDGDKNGTVACDIGAFEAVPAAPSVAFQASTSSGGEASGTQSIPVKLSTSALGTVTVKYAVTGGTAKPGEDYVLAAGTLSFPAGTTVQNIAFKSVNNGFFEPTETVVISLSAPVNATLGSPAAHTRTITDNDKNLRCGGRTPTIVGTNKNDRINGTAGPDVILGLDGNDTIDGKGGNDIICGGKDNDTITGGRGLDILYGEAGSDTLAGSGGTDLLYGGPGPDRLSGGADAGDFCSGGPGRDVTPRGHGCESSVGIP